MEESSEMKITKVKVFPVQRDDNIRAFASVSLDDQFLVKGIKIIDVNGKLIVKMPDRQKSDGKYEDIAHPIDNVLRVEMFGAILDKYREFTIDKMAFILKKSSFGIGVEVTKFDSIKDAEYEFKSIVVEDNMSYWLVQAIKEKNSTSSYDRNFKGEIVESKDEVVEAIEGE